MQPGITRLSGKRKLLSAVCYLGFFLVCIVELRQASRNRGVCIFKGVFLAPMDDGGRAYALHDPVVNGAVRTRVQQDVCNVIADRQSRIRGFWSLFCRDQWTPSSVA